VIPIAADSPEPTHVVNLIAAINRFNHKSCNWRAREPVRKYVERAAIGLALLLLSSPAAWSRPMRMVECFPAAQAIVDGNNVQYVVRFDSLVDHQTSRMWITQGNRVARTLTPNLNSAPTVLFASSSRLPPGSYQLHWSAMSVTDPNLTDGSVEFTVAK
jgi:methionine-rich copper-binding protein CopC